MADNSPFSVRMDQDDKDKLLQLIQESGRSNKDFMSVLISAYELNKAKIEIPDIAKDIEGLQALTERINDYYVNIGKRITDIQNSKDLQFTKEVEVYKNRVETLKAENDKLDADYTNIQQIYNNISAENEELKKQLEHLQESLRDKTLIVEEYKGKNDSLLSIVEEYKGYKTQIEEYKKLMAETQNSKLELENSIRDKDSIIQKLNDDAEAAKQDSEKIVEELKLKYDRDLESIKERSELQMQKEILKLQQEHQKQILELQNGQQEQLQELHQNYNKEIQGYQDKYKDLLQQLEKEKTVSHSSNGNITT